MKPVYIAVNLLTAILLFPALSNAQSATKINKNIINKEGNMSVTEQNKEVIRQLYEKSMNKRNLELLHELISDDYTNIRGQKGADAFSEPLTALIKAFPDIQWNIEELIGDSNKVVVRWKWTGTHTGSFQQFIPTGKTVSNDGAGIFELKDGKVTNTWIDTDRLGFLQQIEALPADASKFSNKKHGRETVRFIDKFLVPANAKTEFMQRVNFNRNFIKKLPGFIEDAAYERTDEKDNIIFITIAVWENEQAVKKAKEAVQAEYKRQGFDLAAMLERLNITIDRGVYTEASAQ